MFKKDYFFKEVGDIRIGATAYWKPVEDETCHHKYGIGTYCNENQSMQMFKVGLN